MAIPSRMTIGQLIEGLAGKLAAVTGAFGDATIFKKVDLKAIGDKLEEYGYDRYGTEQCYDGRTGEAIDRELFITPTYYQRLQKFVIDEVYSISTGPTCVITRRKTCCLSW
jgi:DNA-directed RNA polymerase beta subunit